MALTFPRDMPTPGRIPGEIPFFLTYQQSRGLAGGGSPQVADLGPALWRGEWKVQNNTPVEQAVWSAWISSLRGGLRTFKGRPRRRWPMKHPRGFAGLTVSGAAFTGSGTLSAIGGGRSTATVGALPIGLVLSPGDFFSIPVGARQHLHKITEGGTASGAGAAAISFEPPLHQNAATGAAVLLDGPWCDMVCASDPKESTGFSGGSVTFDGTQVLL